MLDDMKLFIEVSRRKSFAEAAEDLRIGAPTLSKRVAALEQKVGQSLMTRSSRGVVLTSFGQKLFDDLSQDIIDIDRKFCDIIGNNSNVLRLLCPQNLIVGPLFSVISQFQGNNQNLELHIEPSNKNALLSQKQFDIAFRVGEQVDSSYYQKKVGEIVVRFIGRNKSTHTETLYTPYNISQIPQGFNIKKQAQTYRRTSYVGDISLARKLLEAGNGAALLPMSEIEQISLKQEHDFRYQSELYFTRAIYAIWPNSRNPPPKVKDLIGLVSEHCSNSIALNAKSIPL